MLCKTDDTALKKKIFLKLQPHYTTFTLYLPEQMTKAKKSKVSMSSFNAEALIS